MFIIKKDITMKKLIIIAAVCILSACSNDFLEVYPETSLNVANFYQNQDHFITSTNACYIGLRNYNKTSAWAVAEIPSDNSSYMLNSVSNAYLRGPSAYDMFLEYVAPDWGYGAMFWKNAYKGIYDCNVLLREIERDITWDDEAIKDRCKGEAYFLRGLYYFDLVRSYGGVPIVTKVITASEAVDTKRATVEQVYEVIINDLKEAIIHFSKAKDVEENGRASLGAAKALLGKVYLTLHDYPAAEKELHDVIISQKYSLLDDYAALFDPANKDFTETIFAVQYSEGSVALANNFIFWFAPSTSKGEVTLRPAINISLANHGANQPTQDLIDAFEPGDLRKDVSIKWWTGPDWDLVVRDIPYCGKYKPPVSAPDDRCSDNMPILRYSDVLLMYAEALNNQGKTGQAIPYVEQVRNRAGLMNSLAGNNQSQLDDIIAHERQVEFCFENHRWNDLKRTGKILEVMTAHVAREKSLKPWLAALDYTVDPKKFLLPIPTQEIVANHLEQNPGY